MINIINNLLLGTVGTPPSDANPPTAVLYNASDGSDLHTQTTDNTHTDV